MSDIFTQIDLAPSLIRDAILKRIESEPKKKDIGKMSVAQVEKALRET